MHLAAEAVETLALRIDHERRVVVLVKGAAADQVLPAPAQGEIAPDQIFNGNGRFEAVRFMVFGPLWNNRPRTFPFLDLWLWDPLIRLHEALENRPAPAQANKEVGCVASLTDFLRQLD